MKGEVFLSIASDRLEPDDRLAVPKPKALVVPNTTSNLLFTDPTGTQRGVGTPASVSR